LGLLFSEQRKLKAAEIEFDKAIKLDPSDTDAINQRDLVHRQIQLQ
jgi:hypothetical protein